MNCVNLTGRLCNAAEYKTVGESVVASFGLIVNRYVKKDSGKKDSILLNCSYWGRGAEAVREWMTKGRQVGVTARVDVDSWVDKEGHPRNAVKFVVESLVLLAPGKEAKPDVVQPRGGALEESREKPANDDIPF
jgi:single-strand DNA-binding protein